MKRVVVLGGGVSGHTAASYLNKLLGKKHQVTVVTPNKDWNWIPSNIWVGVGQMDKSEVLFDLATVYKKAGIEYVQAKAVSIHPEGGANHSAPYVMAQGTGDHNLDQMIELEYDYVINATGPKLNFGATPGLGIGNQLGEHTVSVCTASHAEDAAVRLQALINEMKGYPEGKKATFLIGTGHGTCTCQGAAFEYIFNVDHKLRKAGVRDKAEIVWISNEQFLGDFGMGAMHLEQGGYTMHSKSFAESIFAERDIRWIVGAHVKQVEAGKVEYELLDGTFHEQDFDFAMLIPPFAGQDMKAFDASGEDITSTIFAPSGFMKVDADYTPKPYAEWSADDWPKKLQNPTYSNMFAVGIAFAPPHQISQPRKSPNDTLITPAPPRTGMPSATMARAVAENIVDMINGVSDTPTRTASMAQMGAACIASTGKDFFTGTAAAMTVYPVVPDYAKFPETGRDQSLTSGEIGLGAHWIKHTLHHLFIYKAKLKPFWSVIPE